MPNVAILRTIVTPDANGTVVELQISDEPQIFDGSLLGEDAAIRISLNIRIPDYGLPLLAQLERAALSIALDALSGLLDSNAAVLRASHYDLVPALRADPNPAPPPVAQP